MKNHTIMTAVIALSTLGIGATAAAGEGMKEGHANHAMSMMDTNKDGKISAAEYSTAEQNMFAEADTNKDGKITAAEMDAAHKAKAGAMKSEYGAKGADGMDEHDRSSANMIKKLDTDGDGALTAAEHAAGMQVMFSKMDTNKDGTLTAAELKAGHDKSMSAKADDE